MSLIKKLFTKTTGYWIPMVSTLPVGTNLFLDIHKRLGYGPLQTIFDVGANTGQTWEYFRREEKSAKIYCFGPVASTFNSLSENLMHDKNCIAERIAFGTESGTMTISIFEDDSPLNSLNEGNMNKSENARKEEIDVETIDNYCARNGIGKMDLVKIDTEGYEINVLNGAAGTLCSQKISFIYCEVGFLKNSVSHTYFSDLSEWLALRRYYFVGLYQLTGNGWKDGDYFGNALFVQKSLYNLR